MCMERRSSSQEFEVCLSHERVDVPDSFPVHTEDEADQHNDSTTTVEKSKTRKTTAEAAAETQGEK